jgi:hypothetical protein
MEPERIPEKLAYIYERISVVLLNPSRQMPG